MSISPSDLEMTRKSAHAVDLDPSLGILGQNFDEISTISEDRSRGPSNGSTFKPDGNFFLKTRLTFLTRHSPLLPSKRFFAFSLFRSFQGLYLGVLYTALPLARVV